MGAFFRDEDPIHGSVYIFVDPVTYSRDQKFISGGCDFVNGDGHSWLRDDYMRKSEELIVFPAIEQSVFATSAQYLAARITCEFVIRIQVLIIVGLHQICEVS